MAKPRITGHQLQYLFGIRSMQFGNPCTFPKMLPKSWINDKGNRVWTFHIPRNHPVKGDPWDTQTGESLLKKGIIEPSFSMVHDGSYENWPNTEVQFYRLTELGLSYLI